MYNDVNYEKMNEYTRTLDKIVTKKTLKNTIQNVETCTERMT